jgi:hypothetical protein
MVVRSSSTEQWWYDPHDLHAVAQKYWQAPQARPIYEASSEVIRESAVHQGWSVYLPPKPPEKLNRDRLRAQLLEGEGRKVTVVGKSVDRQNKTRELLCAQVNAQGEPFFLWREDARFSRYSVQGAVDDQGRRYVTAETPYCMDRFSSGWHNGALTKGATSATWLIPLATAPPRVPPKTLTLLFGHDQGDREKFWRQRAVTASVPFPTERCPVLPPWTPALDAVPPSPTQLERNRVMARATEAFLDHKTAPQELTRWCDALQRLFGGEPGWAQTALTSWRSRVAAETGNPHEARRLLESLFTEERSDTYTLWMYIRPVMKCSPAWKAACGELFTQRGMPQ